MILPFNPRPFAFSLGVRCRRNHIRLFAIVVVVACAFVYATVGVADAANAWVRARDE
jgi:hypothetical protein